MSRFMLSFVLVALVAMLTACGGNSEDNKVTETRMNDLDSVEGTISDDMINTDESTDEAPVDAAPPADTPKSKDDKKRDDKPKEPAAPKTDDKAEAE